MNPDGPSLVLAFDDVGNALHVQKVAEGGCAGFARQMTDYPHKLNIIGAYLSEKTLMCKIIVRATERPGASRGCFGEERAFLIRRGPEGRGTWRVFRGAGPDRLHL